MQISNKSTNHILIKAWTNSDWDYCDFALINLSNKWIEMQKGRLEAIKPFTNDFIFHSLCFYDESVTFYRIDENDSPDIEKLLENKSWAFVKLDDNELDNLIAPENALVYHKLVIYRDATARYEAFGKHTDENFVTDAFSLKELIGQVKPQ